MANPEVTFITGVAVNGFLNGVVNLALETAQFLPATGPGDETKIEVAAIITANLRFDLRAAQQIRDALDMIIEQNTKPKVAN